MKNHWLYQKQKKTLSRDLENLFMELWADDGTLKQFFEESSDELADFFGDHTVHAVDTEDDKIIVTFRRP